MRKRSMPKKISNSFPMSYELNANIRPRFIWCCKLANFSRSCGEEKCKFSSKGGCFEENSRSDSFFPHKGCVLRKILGPTAFFPQKGYVLRKILGPTDFFPQKVGVLRKTVAFAEAAATACSVLIQDQGRRIFLPWSR